MIRPVTNALVLASLACLLPAQCPPGTAVWPANEQTAVTPAPGSPAWVRRQMGLKAAAAGDLVAAQKHLLKALELHPHSAAILIDLVRAAGEDIDLQRLWTERLARAAVDARGRLALTRDQKKALPKTAELPVAQKLASLRAKALAEVASWLKRQRPNGRTDAGTAQLAGFGAELVLALGEGMPGPLGAVADDVRRHGAAILPDYETVFTSLVRVMQTRPPADDDDAAVAIERRALRAARILVGLARQAGFKDRRGPQPPEFAEAAEQAREFLGERDRQVQAEARVWSIAELEALTAEERVRFTDEHDTWRRPGVALSPTRRYRIETTCGFETLLGAARTVELHHARLVGHFGKDPFLERQGVVRIVPEHSGLETEGSPFWWAAGFQSGDRTTVRFAWGTIPGLGRLLTHELTHRFDGVLRPFLKTWHIEGHAVWTAAHYARMDDTQCVERYLDLGVVDQTWRMGYGRRKKFEQLLRGGLEEYRDNYTAGYALYAYLRSFLPGEERFRAALTRFERNARGGQKDPIGYFESTFCDGEDGRPASLDEFVEGWQAFLEGVGRWRLDRRDDSNRWIARYGGRGKGEAASKVQDRPTWSWARQRAEPFFGQDHAALATRLLAEAGEHEGTIAAGMWSITVDGWRPECALVTLEASRAVGRPGAAQAFTALARARFPSCPPAPETPLTGKFPRTTAFLAALAERSAALLANGHRLAAAGLAREHELLARRLDLPSLALTDPAAAGRPLASAAPWPVPVPLGTAGWTESSLVSHDRRRHEGLWYETLQGDLHVGRARPREGTGAVDRRAHQRDAFAHSAAWMAPGAYVLRGRVHVTTSFASGSIVFGLVRRDRHLRLDFRTGDFDYAIGRRDDNRNFERVNFSVHGLWERDPEMPGRPSGFAARVADDAAWFDYELQIHGPRVRIRINDEKPRSYTVHDGAPIEGQVGFAMSMGAVRVQDPIAQRLDLLAEGSRVGLDLAAQPRAPVADLIGLPVRGLPSDARGTLVLWVPTGEDLPEQFTTVGLPRAIPLMAKVLNTQYEHPHPWVLAVPRALEPEYRESIQRQVREVHGQPLPIVEHAVGAPFTGSYPWTLFVDGFGILRAAAEVSDLHFHTRVQRWSRKFRPR